MFLSATDRESILNVCLVIEIFQLIHVVCLLITLFNQLSLGQSIKGKSISLKPLTFLFSKG